MSKRMTKKEKATIAQARATEKVSTLNDIYNNAIEEDREIFKDFVLLGVSVNNKGKIEYRVYKVDYKDEHILSISSKFAEYLEVYSALDIAFGLI